MKTRCCIYVVLLSLLLADVSVSATLAAESELPAGVSRVPIGVRPDDRPVVALVTSGFLDPRSQEPRVLTVVDESRDGVEFAAKVADAWAQMVSKLDADRGAEFAFVRIEADAKPAWFSPGRTFYSGPNAAAQYLWRWIEMAVPDLVVEVRAGDAEKWIAYGPSVRRLGELSGHIGIAIESDSDLYDRSLTLALPFSGDMTHIPAALLKTDEPSVAFARLETSIGDDVLPLSEGRADVIRRLNRSPIQVADGLSRIYGSGLRTVAYIPSLTLIGKLRLGELTGETHHRGTVLNWVAPYVSGKRSTLGEKPSGSTLSGHLVFGELADRTKNERFVELACAAANLGFNEDGSLKPSMPYHSEMSDAVFMGTPILVQCGRLTGEQKYFDMAARHLRFMLKLNLRDDGLHQHSPIDPEHTAWGRGNGFPALGMALCLSDLPVDSLYRDEFLSVYRAHMAAMRRHQDGTGMWHQIVDRPESYREFTVTCMTTFAMTRGLRRGWLDRETYEPVVRRAWDAIKLRIGLKANGELVDVCTGTGKQKSRRDYYHRAAILGPDDRGGAMALMVSTEIAFAEREGVVELK